MLIEFILYLLLKYVFDTSCLFQLFCDAWISITLLTSLSKKIIIPIKNLIRNENYLICAKPFFLSFEKKKKNTLLDIAHRMVSSSNWFNILPSFLSILFLPHSLSLSPILSFCDDLFSSFSLHSKNPYFLILSFIIVSFPLFRILSF